MNLLSPLALALLIAATAGKVRGIEMVGLPRVEAAETSAIIRWTTDSESGSRVHFGPEAGRLLQKAEAAGVGTTHVVKIDMLEQGTLYYFDVGTVRKVLATGSFKTAGKAVAPSPAKLGDAPRSNPAKVKRTPPSTKRIWGNTASLPDHFERHGRDFGAKNSDDYARLSWEFFQRAIDDGLPAKVDDSDGTIRVWDPKTGAFGAYNRDGTTKTYFKPGSAEYFQRQPGRPTKLKRKD